jgi:hypothetical protein
VAYKQGLSDEFVAALNDLFASPQGRWWKTMLTDPELFVAIRNEAVNVYFKGCSLAELKFDGSSIVAKTHYKYLFNPNGENEYVIGRNGAFDHSQHWGELSKAFIPDLDDIQSIKNSAKTYAGTEKTFVAQIIKNHRNIVDVEIALTTTKELADEPTAKRLDLSILRLDRKQPTLQFFEAKAFARLRGPEKSKVIGQMSTYSKLLSHYEEDIKLGFIRSSKNILELRGFSKDRRRLAALAPSDPEDVIVDCDPVLIAVGMDSDHKLEKSVWSQVSDKLEAALGAKDRLIVRGKAVDVALGAGNPRHSSAKNQVL